MAREKIESLVSEIQNGSKRRITDVWADLYVEVASIDNPVAQKVSESIRLGTISAESVLPELEKIEKSRKKASEEK